MVIDPTLATSCVLSFIAGYCVRSPLLKRIVSRSIQPTNSLKLVLVVRSDLGMTKGKIASQCSHAAVSCYKLSQIKAPKVLEKWELQGQPKIVLRLYEGGESTLIKLGQKSADLGLPTALIRDAGHTQVLSGTPTVLGIGPGDSILIDKITSSLKLL